MIYLLLVCLLFFFFCLYRSIPGDGRVFLGEGRVLLVRIDRTVNNILIPKSHRAAGCQSLRGVPQRRAGHANSSHAQTITDFLCCDWLACVFIYQRYKIGNCGKNVPGTIRFGDECHVVFILELDTKCGITELPRAFDS